MKSLSIFILGTGLFLAVVAALNRYGNPHLMLVFLTLSLAAPFVYLMVDRSVQQSKLLSMKEEALRAELMSLKNQINPHFFFNTLNNLYGLVVDKSDLAPTMILRLSELMRFTLYEGKKDRILLRDEIKYLENYIALHRIRFHRLDFRGFKHEEVEEELLIPPLLFIIALENAIKHGVSTLTHGAYLQLELRTHGQDVYFSVVNNFDDEQESTKGIGLTNLQRRLKLVYPNDHDLDIDVKDGVYEFQLRICAL